ncbi:MAG: TIM-barrel domain-containing protein [Nostoc sp.]|uniref:TIM-barrel domain-containing protein n=1 Tax=Nostoc sp. TaxID=1180 RepID=UPI002FF23ED6
MRFCLFKTYIALATCCCIIPSIAEASVYRTKFSNRSASVIVEVLDDDLVHFEVSPISSGSNPNQPLYTSPMVLKTNYSGASTPPPPSGSNVIETKDIRLEIASSTLCITAYDKTKQNVELTKICPVNLNQPRKGLNIEQGQIENIYGLGQNFKRLGSADGDWLTLKERTGKEFGNALQDFGGGKVGNVQIPVYYAVGKNNLNYALFLDNVYRQEWNFTKSPWQVRTSGDQLRFYIMTGANLLDLRKEFLELVGRPPVPPRKTFGLWVSEYGYDNWKQIDTILSGLRSNNFPIDGFVLDLNWFGGIIPDNTQTSVDESTGSAMGRLNWDENQESLVADDRYFFPNPASKIRQYASDDIGLATIEESYLAKATNTYREIPASLLAYRRGPNNTCDFNQQSNPVELSAKNFWGTGSMIDWSDLKAGSWIHERRRFPNLVKLGIHFHWTDLGEPEIFNSSACYEGVETTVSGRKIEHVDISNLYNLLWSRSIWEGYFAKRGQTDNLGITNPRPFILSRSGAAGTQRYGAAMWSGDIGSNLQSLATHFNAQMQMSFSGIDYYGADIGGFERSALPGNDKQGSYRGYEDETYTQWFANAAWFDIPVRPHTHNQFLEADITYETSPDRIGKIQSNLANIRQRYELIPYYYSLAYRAYLFAEPVIAPLPFYYQNDPNVRQMANQKLIGRDLLVGAVARYGEYARDIYFPAGRWINYHTNEWIESGGQTVKDFPVYRSGLFRLPVFAKAGAILPQMYVDADTKDAYGRRKNNRNNDELIVRVYADRAPSSFTLYEDDGETLDYDSTERPIYRYRTTEVKQQQIDADTVKVTIAAATNVNSSSFSGAVTTRQNMIRLVVDRAKATKVTLNGVALPQLISQNAFDNSENGWFNVGNNLILAKSSSLNVNTTKTFRFDLAPVAATTSVNFVCDGRSPNLGDRGFTSPGESIYITGNLPALGEGNPAKAIKLDPNVYYQYIIDKRSEAGPTAPVWTTVISGLPSNTAFEWKCLRRENGTVTVTEQSGVNKFRTGKSGYAGQSLGSF